MAEQENSDNPEVTASPRPWWRRRRVLFPAIALVLGLMTAFAIWVYAAEVALWAVERAASQSPAILRADRLKFDGRRGIILTGVTLADEQGIWARAPKVDIRWRPRALLDRHLQLDRLEIPVLAMDRLPQIPESEDDSPIAINWPASPVSINLETLGIARILLKRPEAESAEDEPYAAQLYGHFALQDGRLTLRIETRRTDGVEEGVTVSADVNEFARRIALNAAMYSPKDGWLNHQLTNELAVEAGALKASLRGLGSPEDWNGTFNFELDGVAASTGEFNLAEPAGTTNGEIVKPGEEDRDINLKATANIAPGFLKSFTLPPGLEDRVSGPIAIKGVATIRDRTLTGFNGSVATAHNLAAVVSTAPPWTSHDVAIALAGAPLDLGGVILGKSTVVGKIVTETGKPLTASAKISASDIATGGVTLAKLDGTISAAHGTRENPKAVSVTGAGEIRNFTFGEESPTTLPGPIAWSGNILWDGKNTLTIHDAALRDKGLKLVANGNLNSKTGAASFAADLDVSDLAQVTAGSYGGKLQAKITAKPGNDQQTAWAVTARGSELTSVDYPGLDGLGELTLDAALSYGEKAGSGRLNIESNAFVITGDGYVTANDMVSANLEARAKDAIALRKLFGTPMDEASMLTVAVSGPKSDVALTLRANIPEVGTPPMYFRNMRIETRLGNLLEKPTGGIYLSGEGPVGTMRGVISIASPGLGKYDIRNILIDTPVATFTGFLWLDQPLGLIAGRIDGMSGDLALLDRNIDFEAGGAFESSMYLRSQRLSESWDTLVQTVTMTIKGHKMSTVLADREAVTADLLDAKLTLSTSGGLLSPSTLVSGSGHLDVQGYRSSMLSLKNFAFKLTEQKTGSAAADQSQSAAADLDWSLNVDGDYFGPLKVNGAGGLRYGQNTLDASINRLTGTVVNSALKLLRPTRYRSDGVMTALDPLSLQYGEGTMTASYQKGDGNLTGVLKADKVDLALVPIILGMPPFQGTLDGEATVLIRNGEPSGQMAFATRIQGTDSTGQQLPPFSINMEGALTGERHARAFAITGEINGQNLKGSLEARLPLHVDTSTPSIALDDTAPLSGRVVWNGAVSPVFAFLPPIDHMLSGNLQMDIRLDGNMMRPLFFGNINVTKGEYEHLRFGTHLTDLALAASMERRVLNIESLTAKDGGTGSLSGSGRMTLDRDGLPLGRVTVKLDKANVVNMEAVEARASGNITYARNREAGRLTGELTLDRVEARLVDMLPREITTLEVREVNRYGVAKFDEDDAHQSQRVTVAAISDLDLNIKAENRIFVRGRGLDSEWGGDLTLRGTPEKPVLVGNLDLVHGTFDFAGKEFQLTQGRFRFDGADTINPNINLKAEYASSDLTAFLTVTGTLAKPMLALTSTPSLPQDEILARILFGTSIQHLSALEAVQLASAVSSLTSGGGFDVFGKARSILGLDRLSIGTDSVTGGNIVSGGKYLSRRIYLEVQTDTDTGESKANVRIDITPHLQVEGGVGAENNSNVGVRWKKDY